MRSKFSLGWVFCVALALSGCFDLDDDKKPDSDGGSNAELNQPPTITGAPSANILEGEFYEFTPDASDPDGDTLEFSIARKPAWANFNKSSGRLSGTPAAADVGNFTNIAISVSDGQITAAMAAFDVTVNQIASGTATIAWMPPTANDDGSSLTDLAGYRIYYGRNKDNLAQVIDLDNPGLTRYVIENLTPARWFFTMTSVNVAGVESDRSETVYKTIG